MKTTTNTYGDDVINDADNRVFQILKKTAENRERPISDFILRHFDVSEASRDVDAFSVIGAIGAQGRTSNKKVERALQEVRTISSGGSVIDTYLSAQVLESFLAKSHLARAGMKTVMMDGPTVNIGRIASYPAFEWMAPGASQTEKTIGFDAVQLNAKTLRSWSSATMEFLQDAINAPGLLRRAFSYAGAKAIDYTGLLGTGVGQEPKGIINMDNVSETSMGTNGAAVSNLDFVIDNITAILNNNGEIPNTMIVSPRTWAAINKLKESSTNAYLQRPDVLRNLNILETSAIPNDMDQGTSEVASAAFLGGFESLLLGVRLQLEVFFTPIAAPTASYNVLCAFRGDFAAEREQDLGVIKGIL